MVIEVACGVIINDNKVLCVQRSETMSLPLKWEFPGGKIENNETPEECLKRELKEELGISIKIEKKLNNSFYNYGNFKIVLIPYLCQYEGIISLTEHKNYLWLPSNKLKDLDWALADVPIVNEIITLNE